MIQDLAWLHAQAGRLDRRLRKHLLERYRSAHRLPCVVRSSLTRAKDRLEGMDVIVQWHEGLSSTAEAAVHSHLQRTTRIKHQLPALGAAAVHVGYHQLPKLLEHEDLRRIWLDYPVYTLLDVAAPTVRAPQVWGTGLTGKGVRVAIIDTGAAPHPDLMTPTRRIVAFHDLVGHRAQAYDDNGHGTHCAGDVAGNGSHSAGRYRGPAPEAELVIVKALNFVGSGSVSTILAGMQWVYDHRAQYGIRVLSMSLGGEPSGPASDDPLARMAEQLWRAGIVVCAAAGNNGPDPGTIASPGYDPVIMTVGAEDDHGSPGPADDSVAPFSSRGPTHEGVHKPDLLAPGVQIMSLRARGSFLDKQLDREGWPSYVRMSGTSMATPICAGVVALMLEANPRLTPDQVKQILMQSAHSLAAPRDVQGAGLIDALAAIEQAKETTSAP